MGEVRRPTITTTDPVTGEKKRRTSAIWWIRFSRNGKRHEESSHSKLKGVAKDLLAIREGDKAKGLPVGAAIGKLTFDAAAADVILDYQVNGKRSLAGIQRRVKLHLAPFFGTRKMASITTADVRTYTAQRQEEGAASATINRELAILKRAFRLAEQGGAVLHRPFIPMLTEDNVRTGFFERAEFEDVRAALPEELRGVVTVAYLTGWRVPSEVLTLQWPQVDRRAKTIRLEPGTAKNRRARELPYDLLPELEEVVETAWAEHERLRKEKRICPYLFHCDGQPIKSLRGAWESACRTAGVPGRLVHDLRRSAARNLIRAGVSQTVAMQITGHLTPSVFRRYDITDGADVRQGLGKLAGQQKGNTHETGRVAQIGNRQKRLN